MANETGHPDLAQNWQAEYDDFHPAFFKVLDAQAAAHNGYIPPALDGQTAATTGATCSLWFPSPRSIPHDPRVTATLKATQAKYAEGIMTYADGKFLHHYLTIKNTMTETIRGDQEQALNEFYALLLHTSCSQRRIRIRHPSLGRPQLRHNLAPHGWFAAEYRTLLRTMLVREQGDQLHLLSVVSPAWIGKDKTIAVRQAPTNFGTVAFTLLQPEDGEAVLHLNTAFSSPPRGIIVHLPWFMDLKSATADGKPLQPAGGALTIPAATRTIELRWSMKPSTPRLSYDRSIADYEAEYARRYQALMHAGPVSRH